MLPSYTLHQTTDEQYIANIEATENTGAFDGHFPGQPILPGVVQLDWVMKLSQEIFKIAEPSAQDFQIKFSHIIQPGLVELRLEYSKGKIDFEYHAKDKKCSSGSIKVAGCQSS
jgi:3-hydroxymyristoyl/3-hydroxydecanoyl-(acyl carrier protein) dehydratase